MVVSEKAGNNRCVPRIPLQASINYLTPEIIGKGLAIDVSREGLRIESQDPVHIGMRLALVLYLSNEQEPVMIEDATVQWAIGSHFGVKFVKWSTNAEARLNNFFLTGIQEKCDSLLDLMTEAVKASPLTERIDPQATPLEDPQRDLIRRTPRCMSMGHRRRVRRRHKARHETHLSSIQNEEARHYPNCTSSPRKLSFLKSWVSACHPPCYQDRTNQPHLGVRQIRAHSANRPNY